MKKRRTWSELLRDYTLYVLIVATLIAATFWASFHGYEKAALHTWAPMLVMTVVAFCYFVIPLRHLRRKWRFWAVIAVLLALHFSVFAVIFAHATKWKFIWSSEIILCESIIFQVSSPILWSWLKIDP